MDTFWAFTTGLAAAVAAYITFEIFPILYGKQWIPFLVILGYWGLFAAIVDRFAALVERSTKYLN